MDARGVADGTNSGMHSRRIVAIAGTCLLAGVHLAAHWGPFEDAYITFRYADHLLAGDGFAFNPGERVEGFSSFGWLVWLAALGAIGLPYVDLAPWLSTALGVVLSLQTAWLARRCAGGDHTAGWLPVTAAAWVAAHGTWAYYAASAMETTLFACLINLALAFALTPGTRHAALFGITLALSAMTRPEGVGYAALFTAGASLDRKHRRDALVAAAAFVSLFAPYFLWRFEYFGFLAPNTYYAKASPSLQLFVRGLWALELFLTPYLGWLVFPALVARLRRDGAERGTTMLGLVIGGAMANLVLVGGDTFVFHRFLLPAMPAMAVVMLLGLRDIAPSALRRSAHLVALLLVVWTFTVGFLPTFDLQGVLGPSQAAIGSRRRAINADYFIIGDWLRSRFAADTTIALTAAGIVAQRSGLRVIDMAGLTDVHIAHVPVTLGESTPGHEKHDAGYVLSRRPELILPGIPHLRPTPIALDDPRAPLPLHLQYAPDIALVRHPRFRTDYHPAQFAVGNGYLLIFVRNDFTSGSVGRGDPARPRTPR